MGETALCVYDLYEGHIRATIVSWIGYVPVSFPFLAARRKVGLVVDCIAEP